TEIYDYLRLLFARVGTTICRVCGREVHRDSPESAADEALAELPAETRFYVMFPADAGLRVETNGTDASTTTRRRADTETRGQNNYPLRVAPSPRSLIVAHVMSLMQRGFTRLLHDGKQIDLASPDDYHGDSFQDVF